MEVLILGVYLGIFFFRIKWSYYTRGRALYTGKYGINGSISSKLWTFVTVVLKKCCKCSAVGLSHLYKSPEWNLETSPNAQPVEQSKMGAALVGIIGGHAKKI